MFSLRQYDWVHQLHQLSFALQTFISLWIALDYSRDFFVVSLLWHIFSKTNTTFCRYSLSGRSSWLEQSFVLHLLQHSTPAKCHKHQFRIWQVLIYLYTGQQALLTSAILWLSRTASQLHAMTAVSFERTSICFQTAILGWYTMTLWLQWQFPQSACTSSKY